MSQPKFDPEAPCLFLKQSPCWLPEELVLEADSVQREKKESLAAVSGPRWSNCVIGARSIESKLMNSAYFTMMIINPIVAVYILALDNIIWYDYVYMIYVCLARRICGMLDRNRVPWQQKSGPKTWLQCSSWLSNKHPMTMMSAMYYTW